MFLTGGRMLLQSVAMLTTKFLLDDKITACVKQICLLGVLCKVSDRNTLTNEKFCYQYFTSNSSHYICPHLRDDVYFETGL